MSLARKIKTYLESGRVLAILQCRLSFGGMQYLRNLLMRSLQNEDEANSSGRDFRRPNILGAGASNVVVRLADNLGRLARRGVSKSACFRFLDLQRP